MTQEKRKLLAGAIGFVLLLASCGQPSASPTADATETRTASEPTDIIEPIAEPNATTTPTGTIEPTAEPTTTSAPTGTIEPTPKPTTTTEATATETPDGSEFWIEMQDPHYGVGFAVPCYWEVNFPQDYPPGGSGISYSIRNYTEEYVLSFPRGRGVFENGGIKIDMNFMHGPSWGAAAGTSLIDFVSGLYSNDPETSLEATEELIINGQPALLVTTDSKFGIGQFYAFVVTDEVYLLFGPNAEARSSPDVLGILNSIALTSDVSVTIPDAVPENPPKGLVAPCMGITELPPDPNAPPEGCQARSFASVEELTSGLEENFHKANTGGLIFDYVNEPFAAAMWRSEGQEYSRNEFFGLLANSYYNYQVENIAEGKPSQMTFTTDRGQFPPLMGIPAATMFGPDVNIAEVIYSEGWGQDGLGAALLFIAEDDCGRFYWHGLVFSPEHFDK
jgi:hypothetical protein